MNVGTYTAKLSVAVAVLVPEVPVMVRVLGPSWAVLDAVSVSVLSVPFAVVGLGEKDAVTPLGSPVTERLTLPVNPYWGLTKTYEVVVVPCPILTLPPPESVNVGAYTPSVSVVVALRVPAIPVIVNGYWPAAAELLTVSVSAPVPVVGLGFQSAVTPFGSPDTPRVTLPEKPYSGCT